MLVTCLAGPGERDFFAIVSTKLSLLFKGDFHFPRGEFAVLKASRVRYEVGDGEKSFTRG
jgi:hypothetical protein